MDDGDSRVRQEAAVQVIQLAGAVGLVILGVVLQVSQRRASDPDFVPQLRSRWAHRRERWWARLAAWSWARAERARVEWSP